MHLPWTLPGLCSTSLLTFQSQGQELGPGSGQGIINFFDPQRRRSFWSVVLIRVHRTSARYVLEGLLAWHVHWSECLLRKLRRDREILICVSTSLYNFLLHSELFEGTICRLSQLISLHFFFLFGRFSCIASTKRQAKQPFDFVVR